jgi:hypothetical protein
MDFRSRPDRGHQNGELRLWDTFDGDMCEIGSGLGEKSSRSYDTKEHETQSPERAKGEYFLIHKPTPSARLKLTPR